MNLIRKVISIIREKALKIFGRKNGIYYINGSETLKMNIQPVKSL